MTKKHGFAAGARLYLTLLVGLLTLGQAGCSRFRAAPQEQFVYVTAKQTFLRDRVAAVSNRTATVSNGDKLKVLEHGRRFVKVRTEKGEIGWIDEKVVVNGDVLASFDTLKDQHKGDSVVASAVVRDEVYLHLSPGRDTERFYRLAEGDKLSLLKRATIVKANSATTNAARARRAIPQAVGTSAAKSPAAPAVPEASAPVKPDAGDQPAPPPVVMEDWWLVRDGQGHTGWLYARMMDVDAPDTIVRYAEGQRIVGAYVLTTLHDPDAGTTGSGLDVPVYVTVLSPYKAGLPYDFDQVRVFTWNMKKHRYETGFRQRNIEGYLPVTITNAVDPNAKPGTPAAQPAPTFSYKALAADAPPVVPDPVTGAMVPGKTVTQTFRLEGSQLRRILPPGSGAAAVVSSAAIADTLAHPEAVEKKEAKGKAGRHRH
ncbi:SH3 domain-containing protein [Granulicella sp. WH15]|uniref:SH3 domain-containing protein n=1 Tax=Granulicella sp. WH15 TaxID=2602070 RepID=UPI0021069DC1|nr:SH3 domain-containing protein [Granulicella sp. WH15]